MLPFSDPEQRCSRRISHEEAGSALGQFIDACTRLGIEDAKVQRLRDLRWIIAADDDVWWMVDAPPHPEFCCAHYLVIVRGGRLLEQELIGVHWIASLAVCPNFPGAGDTIIKGAAAGSCFSGGERGRNVPPGCYERGVVSSNCAREKR